MMNATMSKTPQSARHGGALKLHRGATFGEVSIAPLQPKTRQNSPIPETGTACAISYSNSGVAANLPCNGDTSEAERAPPHERQARFREARPGRGGARNHADRESHSLTTAHVANLRAAERHAARIGLPFNRMISIHWEGAGVPLADMAKATGRFTDLMAKALARHGSGIAWLWTHENGDGKGGHCHLLAHVPADLVSRLTALQRGWLRRITGQPYRARVIHSKPIGGRLGLETGNPDLHAVNLEAALSYVLKGASPEAASQFGLERLEPGGRVIGKRCGTSQNIGAKARKAKE